METRADNKEDVTSTEDIPSEYLRTQKSEFAPKFHKFAKMRLFKMDSQILEATAKSKKRRLFHYLARAYQRPRNPYKTRAKALRGESGRISGTKSPFERPKWGPSSLPILYIYTYM